MHAVHGARPAVLVQLLKLGLDVGERVRVEQVAQLGVAEQLAQLRLIDRQRLRATLGERRVAVVEVVRDVAEQQRRGERRRDASSRPSRRGSRAAPSARAFRRAPACRRRPAGIRDTPRARWGRIRIATRRRADRPRACAAATAGCVRPAGAWAGAAPGRPPRGTSPRTSRSPRAVAAPAPRLLPRRAASAAGSGGSSVSGNRTTNPSSVHIVSTSSPVSARARSTTAMAHGAWMRLPKGERTQMRQSPSSSRQRSMRTVRSSGTTPAAAR